MKRVCLVLCLITCVTVAHSQEPNTLGLYFFAEEIGDEVSHISDPGNPFEALVVLLAPSQATVGGYEVGITIPDAALIASGPTGPNGMINFGDSTNHLCGYQTPVPADPSGTVLSTLTFSFSGDGYVPIFFGPADPPSLPGAPAITDGDDPDILLPCNLFAEDGLVAEINPTVAAEQHTLGGVKALFR